MKWKFAAHKYAAHKYASGRFAGLGVDPILDYVNRGKYAFRSGTFTPWTFDSGTWTGVGTFSVTAHYHVIQGPSAEYHPVEGPSQKTKILAGSP